MQNGDTTSLIIILVGHGELVKIFIALNAHGIFRSNCAYKNILTFLASGMQNKDETLPNKFDRCPRLPHNLFQSILHFRTFTSDMITSTHTRIFTTTIFSSSMPQIADKLVFPYQKHTVIVVFLKDKTCNQP